MTVGNWSGSPRLLAVRSPKETNRIALVGGDIILEEEEEDENVGEGEEGEENDVKGENMLKAQLEKSGKEVKEETEKLPKNDSKLDKCKVSASEKNCGPTEDRDEDNVQRITKNKSMVNDEQRRLPTRPRSEINVPERVFSPSSSRRPTAPRPVYVNASALKAMKMATNTDKPFC